MIKEVSNRIKNEHSQFDVLSDVLDTIRFRGSIFFRSELAAPWGMSLQGVKTPRFHIALNGDFFIGAEHRVNDVRAVNVKHMDIVMLPHGDMHWIADQTGRELTPSEQAGEACELGSPLFQQGQFTHKLICGLVQYDEDAAHPILDSLPAILHFSELQPDDPIWMTVMIIDTEMKAAQHSQSSIIDRLTEVLFLQLLNRYIRENTETVGFLSALQNRRIHRVLELIHKEPEFQWSLELLGKHVGMSRATLARQFKNAVGVPPMTYIANWRMMKANHLIKYSSISLDQIADLVGFSTARSLNKAFQRHYGFTPSELRRQ